MQNNSCIRQGVRDSSERLQAKLVKSAVTGALLAAKESHPLTLLSGFEQRMGCLADIARSSTLTIDSHSFYSAEYCPHDLHAWHCPALQVHLVSRDASTGHLCYIQSAR